MPGVIDNPALGMYVAAAVALVVLLGFFWYVRSIGRGVAELRRRLNERPSPFPQVAAPVHPHMRAEEEHEDVNTRT